MLYINLASHLSEVGNYYFTCFTDEDTKALRSFMTLSRSLRQQMAEVKFNSGDWLQSLPLNLDTTQLLLCFVLMKLVCKLSNQSLLI